MTHSQPPPPAPTDIQPSAIDPGNPEPLLAGTLTLMSCFTNHQCPAIAAKVEHNLRCLAQHVALSLEFRGLCERLQRHWRQQLDNSPHRKHPATDSGVTSFSLLH